LLSTNLVLGQLIVGYYGQGGGAGYLQTAVGAGYTVVDFGDLIPSAAQIATVDILYVNRQGGSTDIETFVQSGGPLVTEIILFDAFPCSNSANPLVNCDFNTFYFGNTGTNFLPSAQTLGFDNGISGGFLPVSGGSNEFYSDFSTIAASVTLITQPPIAGRSPNGLYEASGSGCVCITGSDFLDDVVTGDSITYTQNVMSIVSTCQGVTGGGGGDPHITDFSGNQFDIPKRYHDRFFNLYHEEFSHFNIKISKLNFIHQIGATFLDPVDRKIQHLEVTFDKIEQQPQFYLNGVLQNNDELVSWMILSGPRRHKIGTLSELERYQSFELLIKGVLIINGGWHPKAEAFLNIRIIRKPLSIVQGGLLHSTSRLDRSVEAFENFLEDSILPKFSKLGN